MKSIARKLCIAASSALLLAASTPAFAAAKEMAFLGQYSSISVSPQSGDCDGFGIRIWSSATPKAMPDIVGDWTEANGPCNNQSMPIFDVQLNRKTGAITFSTMNASQPDGARGHFQGNLSADALVGDFLWGGQPAGTAAVHLILPRSSESR